MAAKTGEAERLKAEAAAAARAADLLGDEAAAEIRSARDAAWSAHRAALDRTSADVFEAAMRRDDAAGAARRGRRAGTRRLARARDQARGRRSGTGARQSRSRSGGQGDRRARSSRSRRLRPPRRRKGRDALAFIDAWRVKRNEALTLIDALRQSEDAERRAEDEGERMRERLSAALRAAGVAHDQISGLEALIEAAETALADEAKLADACGRRRRSAAPRRLAPRPSSEIAKEADANWRSSLARGVRRDVAWRGRRRARARRGQAIAEGAGRIARDAERLRRARRPHRQDGARQARCSPTRSTRSPPRSISTMSRGDVRQRAEAIEERVARARARTRAAGRRRSTRSRRRTARLKAIAEELEVNARQASAMTALFAVGTLAEVAAKLEDCKRRDALKAEIAREKAAIIAANVAGSLEAARAILERADAAALTAELAALKARAPHDDQAHAEAHSAHREAVKRLEAVGGDDAVARLEEKRRTILEAVNDGARRYLTLRAGIAAAEEALRLFRDRHRGAMMDRASEAFRLISRGAYRALTTAPNGQSETLIALGADGGSKEAAQLSKGARFQLYLALRVAGYHELAKTRAPAPFVADDIMETFDHFRAEEALRLFADMGRVGQVIYFTHHQHLAELAKAVCPEARVHELAA